MSKSLVKNAADEEQVKEAEIRERWSREGAIEDLRFVMSTPAGRRFVYRMTNAAKTEDPISTDTHMTYFNLGLREPGRLLTKSLLEHCEEQHDLMIREARKAKK